MNRNEFGDEQNRLPDGYRSFATLEDDLAQGSGMFPCGLLAEAHTSSVISADVKDPKFHAAIFGHDDSPVPDMRPEELQQTRPYIIHGEGTAPIRKCRHHAHGTPGLAVLCPSEARG
jgi:hypothetical protein